MTNNNTKNDLDGKGYDPTSKAAAVELCKSLGLDPDEHWGTINDFACDAFYAGQADAVRARE